jgi:hypothetical protein
VTNLLKAVAGTLRRVVRRNSPTPTADSRPGPGSPAAPPAAPRQTPSSRHRGRVIDYSPDLDGDADPGEIVWTWVAYEEDPDQGKDRPVLVVGRDGRTLLGLMLSSRDDRDGQDNWFPLGPGDWDRDRRASWVRLDRVLEVDEDGIRREGAVLDRSRFENVAAELRRGHGWS